MVKQSGFDSVCLGPVVLAPYHVGFVQNNGDGGHALDILNIELVYSIH